MARRKSSVTAVGQFIQMMHLVLLARKIMLFLLGFFLFFSMYFFIYDTYFQMLRALLIENIIHFMH